MANNLNQCNFIGNLGKEPESRFAPSGSQVVTFSIAVGWKSKDKEGTEWVNITAFGKLAEICANYLHKGSKVFISGRYKTDKYEKDGQTRYSTGIVADKMEMLDSRGDGQSSGQPQQQAPQNNDGFDDWDNDKPPF